MNRLSRLFTLAIVTATFLGCSGGNTSTPAKVSGRISYKGTPIKAGHINFVTADNTSYPGRIDSDGTYTASDLPAGEIVVTVETESLKPKAQTGGNAEKYMKMQASRMKGSEGKTGAAEDNTANYVKLPTKYNSAKTSPLTITLTRGRNVKDLELID